MVKKLLFYTLLGFICFCGNVSIYCFNNSIYIILLLIDNIINFYGKSHFVPLKS